MSRPPTRGKQRSNIFAIVIILIIIASTGFAGYIALKADEIGFYIQQVKTNSSADLGLLSVEAESSRNIKYVTLATSNDTQNWINSDGEYENWTLKYPTDWEYVPKSGYGPRELSRSQFNLSFMGDMNVRTKESLSEQVVSDYEVLKKEYVLIDDKETILQVLKGHSADIPEIQMYVFVDGVNFTIPQSQNYDSMRCQTGVLGINAFYKNPPTFDQGEMPYEQKIRDILSTIQFNDCINTSSSM